MLDFPVVQIAYFVTDARAAAEQAASTFGAGPFFLIENIELAWCEHRGVAADFLHTSAYGQWGGVMMELVEQVGEGPSPFRDMYGPGEEGIHHMAMMVDSLSDAYNRIEALGLEVAMRAGTRTGTDLRLWIRLRSAAICLSSMRKVKPCRAFTLWSSRLLRTGTDRFHCDRCRKLGGARYL